MDKFKYDLAKWLPFRDKESCDRVRAIQQKDLCKHPNPNVKIETVPDAEFLFRLVWDIFSRIKQSADERAQIVLILPEPHPEYALVADLINKYRVSCKKLYAFNMDEYTNKKGHTPPIDWPQSFARALMQNFYYRIDEDLRPARSHMNYPTHENINRYGDMIADLGGADVCYAPIGWSGHVAFIEPDEFKGDLEEWKKSGPKLVDLSPFTILQNSLFSDFGEAGDWSWIPPKAVTIGPAEIVNSKLVCSWNGYFGEGKNVTWQKFIVRLAVHGPVTTKVPASILQTLHTNFHISEKISTNITAEIDY